MKKEEKVNIYIPYTRTFVSEHTEGDPSNYDGFHEEIFESKLDGTFSWEAPSASRDYCMESIEKSVFDKNPQKLFAVYVIYSDGGTFGKTTGYVHVDGIYEDKQKANEHAKKISKRDRDKGYESYKPWTGFFCSLEEVGVEELTPGKNLYKKRFF